MTETQHGASSEIMAAISAATTDPPKNMVHPNPTPKDFSYYDTSYYMASEQQTTNETDPTPAALQSNTYPRRRARFRFAAVTGAFGALLIFSIVLARAMGTPTQVLSPLLGRLAPTVDLVGLDRGRVSSADLDGKLYVINFWASWCVPCREEAPVLQDFAARHSDGTVELLGGLFADTLPAARAFVKEFHLTYPQLRD